MAWSRGDRSRMCGGRETESDNPEEREQAEEEQQEERGEEEGQEKQVETR